MADLRAVARAKAKKYGLDPGVFERQIQQESGFNPGARSPAGALGVAQIMPATARGWGVNPLNPSQALDAAARNMARYVQQFGSYEKALRAYNAGPGNVEKSKGFAETNNYVRTILGGGGGSAPRLLTTKRTVPGALIAGAAGMSLTTPGISFDAKGYDEARRKSILGEMVAKRNPNSILLRSGLLTTVEPSTSDFTKEVSSTTRIAGLGSYRIPSSTSTSTTAGRRWRWWQPQDRADRRQARPRLAGPGRRLRSGERLARDRDLGRTDPERADRRRLALRPPALRSRRPVGFQPRHRPRRGHRRHRPQRIRAGAARIPGQEADPADARRPCALLS
jgi:hypothetical protein